MKRITAIIGGVATLLGAGNAHAIDLEEVFTQVKQTHPLFIGERLRVDAATKRAEGYTGAEDWVARIEGSSIGSQTAWQQPFTPESWSANGVTASVERIFWNGGGAVSLSAGTTSVNQTIPDAAVPTPQGDIIIPGQQSEYFENQLSLTYVHPLMKNRGGNLYRLGYEMAKREVAATSLKATENQEALLESVGELFIDLAALVEQQNIAHKRVTLAKKEYSRTESKRRQNLVDAVDLYRAADAVLAAKQGEQAIRSGVMARRAELAKVAGIDSALLGDLEFDLYQIPSVPTVKEAEQTIRVNSRHLAIIDERIGAADLVTQAAAQEQEPQLDVTLRGTAKSASESFGDATTFDNYDYGALLTFSYPLGNRAANAKQTTARIERLKLDADRASTSRQLEGGAEALLAQLKELAEIIALDKKRMVTAHERTDAEYDRYTEGRGELSFVIASRDAEQAVALTRAENAAQFHKLHLRYQALVDQLLQQDPHR